MSEIVSRMTDSLRHRGPDDRGVWLDAESGAAIGHRRLSIIDLSAAGKQPMLSTDGRYVLSFNGEIYNHESLRRELRERGATFRGGSDTEVIVAMCSAASPRAAIERLHGMFAIAIWDRRERKLLLARDRLGIKPLYWSWTDRGLSFASELKALRCHPGWDGRISRSALAAFLRHGYVPGPATIHERVHKLQGGEILAWSAASPEPKLERFWDLRRLASARPAPQREPPAQDIIEQLHVLLADAVRSHMVADVPLGAFLSGGVDSSTVVALMQTQCARPVRTFSIGFEQKPYDEAPQARAVARHLGTDHTELYASGADALELIPQLPEWYDEPFADSSQIPTYLVCAMARQHVTVALSGDGGDELFGGYQRYGWTESLWRWMSKVPSPIRRAAAHGLAELPLQSLERTLAVIPTRLRPHVNAHRLQRLAEVLPARSADELYQKILTVWANPSKLMLGAEEGAALESPPSYAAPRDLLSRMQLIDSLSYLPDDILTKVDRASMAVSLEARVPLLDHRVVEFAWKLPPRLNTADGRGKFPLRQVLAKYVPKELVDRPKQGFGVPLGEWLRGPLRPWAESLLAPDAIRSHGLLDTARVQQVWKEHLEGRRNAEARVWLVLMLQAWLQRWHSPS